MLGWIKKGAKPRLIVLNETQLFLHTQKSKYFLSPQ